MSIKIYTIGGFSEVGKNMTAVDLGEDVVLFDCGLFLPPIVELESQEKEWSEKKLRNIDAVPNDLILDKLGLRDKVRAILVSHAHLDHVGAVPYLGNRYNAEVVATPFTIEVLRSLIKDTGSRLKNNLKAINPNGIYVMHGKKRDYKIEFLNITHSTLQAALIALHTDEGVILYANDFKFDNYPVLGKKPNYARLKELAKQGILCLIVDSLYSGTERKTPSEKIARGLLEDVLLTTGNQDSAIIVTTFSSHLARLKSIVDCAQQLKRKIVFVGRSLRRYVGAADKLKLIPYMKKVNNLISYKNEIEKVMKKVMKERNEWLIVCTGHQGEPGSVLERMSRDTMPFRIMKNDHVVFSSSIIPNPINISNRQQLEKKLKAKGARIFTDVHVSVLPDTPVVINQENEMEIKKIKDVKQKVKVPAFDKDLKIKWFNAELIKHPYNGKIFTIKTKSGRKVDITGGHSLFILENGQVKEIKGDELKQGDYIAIPKNFSWYKELKEIDLTNLINKSPKWRGYKEKEKGKWIYYNHKKISKKVIKLTPSFAKLLGYYLAEGSAPRHISFVFNKNEKELIEEVKNSIKKIFPCNVNVSNRIHNSTEITFGARILKEIFKKWFGENAKTKRIPDFIFSADRKFKLNFLGAYINGDGSIDRKYKRIRIRTASEKLASDLLYLFTQVGVCAKFDHKEKIPARFIGENKKLSAESLSYVIRIQGRDSLAKIYKYLSNKFKTELFDFLFRDHKKPYLTMPPEALPLSKLALDEIKPKKHASFEWMIKRKNHVNPGIISRDCIEIGPSTERIIQSDLLFDPVVEINQNNYAGDVYDFKVPGAENFIGGFGGIMLHNSGHCGREDLRDLIEMTQPQHIIPAHGNVEKLSPMVELAQEMGYKLGKDVHLMQDGQKLTL